MSVFLTFADAERRVRPRLFAAARRVPSGWIHAARGGAERSLCGLALDQLSAFGRSRHPFERYPAVRRCPTCHVAAGRPTPVTEVERRSASRAG